MNELIKQIVNEMIENGFYETHFTTEQIKLIEKFRKEHSEITE